MHKETALIFIAAEIAGTNNGKLMRMRLPENLRQYVPELLADGSLIRATFLQAGDAIRLNSNH